MEIINYDNKLNEINMDDIIFHGSYVEDYNYLEINWVLLYGCNYRCSYCFGQDVLSKKDFIPLEKLKHAVDNIFKIDKEYYTFTLLGGEVTYYPYFLELVEYIYSFDKKISILLITNASKNISYFEKLLSYVGSNDFMMTFSIHFEYADIEHIKNLILLFNKYKMTINIDFMLHPEYKEKIKLYFDELIKMKEEYYFNFNIVELREPPNFTNIDSRYDKDFFDWIDNARNIIKNTKSNTDYFTHKNIFFPQEYFIHSKDNKLNNISIEHSLSLRNNLKSFTGFYCCGGINILRIGTDGSYKAGICKQFPVIGNIYEDYEIDLYRLSNFIKCNIKQCGCSADDRNNKYRDVNEAKKYISGYRKKYSELILNNLLFVIDNLNKKINTTDNKINKIVNSLAWWIPIKKVREKFKSKYFD